MREMIRRIRERFAKKAKPETTEKIEITITMTAEEWETIRTATVICKYVEAARDCFTEDFDWSTYETAMETVRWACKQAYADYYDDSDNPYDY